MNDPYLDVIEKDWDKILLMYKTFEDKKPIIEYHVDDGKIYSYPAGDYLKALSSRTRDVMKQQYAQAIRSNQFIVFIKDSKNQRLRSYLFDL